MARARRSLCLTFALGALWAGMACQPRPRSYRVEDLGIPRTERAVQARGVLAGQLLAALYETKGECRLLVADLSSGRRREVPLPGTTGADAIALDGPAGRAYLGTSRRAGVWVYDNATGAATRIDSLDPFLKDETYVWSLAIAPSGLVYAGTYPSGLLLEHDPKTGRSRSLGAPFPGRKYLHDLVVGPSGKVYCSLGTTEAIAAVDPRTGSVRRLLEGSASSPAFAGALHIVGSRLCDDSQRCFEVREPAGAGAGPAAPHVDIDDHGAYHVELAGQSYQGVIDLTSTQDGMMTMGLGTGPDGRIYGGTYYNSSLFVVDPGTGRISALGRVRDASGEFRIFQSMGATGLLLPGYHTAPLFLYDVEKPWSEDRAAPNPRLLGEIGQGQHLATCSDRRNGLVAIGTPPGYGRRGGAVTFFDEARLTWRTYLGPVPDQAVQSLCFGPHDRLYVGTSLEAGPGEDAGKGSAHLVVIDPSTGHVVRDLVPVPGATSLNALAPLDGDRILAGVETGQLFTLTTSSGEVRSLATLPHIRELHVWTGDASIVGIGWRKGLFRVDPDTLGIEWIPGSPDRLLPGIAEDRTGRLYVHDGTRVYRVTPRGGR
jgi:outer membrane protein assembly factor BamB